MEGFAPTHPKELIYSQPPLSNLAASPLNFGGGDRTRTRYLLLAKQPLSQLSYTPDYSFRSLESTQVPPLKTYMSESMRICSNT